MGISVGGRQSDYTGWVHVLEDLDLSRAFPTPTTRMEHARTPQDLRDVAKWLDVMGWAKRSGFLTPFGHMIMGNWIHNAPIRLLTPEWYRRMRVQGMEFKGHHDYVEHAVELGVLDGERSKVLLWISGQGSRKSRDLLLFCCFLATAETLLHEYEAGRLRIDV
jgi:hypothetical protein